MMIHAYSAYTPKDSEGARRHRVAQESWAGMGWQELPISDMDLPRRFYERGTHLPYIRDLFDYAVTNRDDSDIVVFTNSDIGVASDARFSIAEAHQFNDATYAFRRDFNHKVEKPIPDVDIGRGVHYPGSDLFAFRAGWWRYWRNDYPDLILAREAWDACMRVLVEQTNKNKPISIPNIIWHERHPNGWEAGTLRYSLPGQLYNLRLASAWLVLRGYNPAEFGIRKV